MREEGDRDFASDVGRRYQGVDLVELKVEPPIVTMRCLGNLSRGNAKCNAIMVMFVLSTSTSLACPFEAGLSQEVHWHRLKTAFVRHSCRRHQGSGRSRRHLDSANTLFMTNHDDGPDDDIKMDLNNAPKELDPRRPQKNFPEFLDAILEIPDPRLLAGDLLFILIINFLLQIANEVSDPQFWMDGGFSQPVTMPTTLLTVMVRDSKMSITWVLGALWNRSYSLSSVSDDHTALKSALKIWVDYCSLRILLELGESVLFTHSEIDIWLLGREAWYTAIVMSFFRLAYSRVI